MADVNEMIDSYGAQIKSLAKLKGEISRSENIRRGLDRMSVSIAQMLQQKGHDVEGAASEIDQDDGGFDPAKNKGFLDVHRGNVRLFRRVARKVAKA